MDHGSVFRRCGCRDQVTGRLLGARCPKLGPARHGSWYLSGELPSPAGARRRVRRGGFATRSAAAAALDVLYGPAPVTAAGIRTGEWLERWLASRVSLRASTSRGYAAHVRGYLVPYLGGIPLAGLSPDVQGMFTAITRGDVALDRTTIAVLRAHQARQQAERAAAGTGWTETGYVFTTRAGTPMGPDRLTRLFRRLVAESGLPPVTVHGLRHGAATLALAAGTDLKIVQDQLGHSTITLTADTYTSVLPETARAAADSTAALLFPARPRHANKMRPAFRRACSRAVPARARQRRGQRKGRAA